MNLLCFLSLLKNWKEILKIVKHINLFRPNFIFVKVSNINFETEIIKWLIITFTKKSKVIFSENQSLPNLNLKKKDIFKLIKPRITNQLSKFFILLNSNKIIFFKIKKRKIKNNIIEILIPSRDADKFIEEKNILKNHQIKLFS